MENQQETEVKFLVFDLAKIEARLRELKAKVFSPRTIEINLRFDNSNGDFERTGRVLRLRKDDLARLTYKGNSQNIEGALSRREIEFAVDDFDSAKQFIEALGYEVAFIYEKYRTTYEISLTSPTGLTSLKIMLDELPYGYFIEIEGKLEMLRPIADELGLDWNKAVPTSYHALFARLCEARGFKLRDLTFENFKEIKVSPKDMMIEYAEKTEG
jgi:adenylate cyclase class 2